MVKVDYMNSAQWSKATLKNEQQEYKAVFKLWMHL
jgi:hypothetical protein